MKAVITVIGVDKVGIIAKVSGMLAEANINILDINQTIMNDLFTMIMYTDIKNMKGEFSAVADALENLGEEMGLQIRITHEDIYKSMHRI
ncbi:MAG: ACT domain-containing protein [Clostridia bacterium]|nr:ACT domain-containing protein [Clostridia bacterium]